VAASIETNRTTVVLFQMENMKFGPYLEIMNMILIFSHVHSVDVHVPTYFGVRSPCHMRGNYWNCIDGIAGSIVLPSALSCLARVPDKSVCVLVCGERQVREDVLQQIEGDKAARKERFVYQSPIPARKPDDAGGTGKSPDAQGGLTT
jgi:hypothetical protein